MKYSHAQILSFGTTAARTGFAGILSSQTLATGVVRHVVGCRRIVGPRGRLPAEIDEPRPRGPASRNPPAARPPDGSGRLPNRPGLQRDPPGAVDVPRTGSSVEVDEGGIQLPSCRRESRYPAIPASGPTVLHRRTVLRAKRTRPREPVGRQWNHDGKRQVPPHRPRRDPAGPDSM